MLAAKIGRFVKADGFFQGCLQRTGQLSEERPRGGIRASDRRFQILDPTACRPGQQLLQHPTGQSLATCRRCHHHLPDKQRIRTTRNSIGRNETGTVAFTLRNDGCLREMRTLQQIAINGVGIEWRTQGDQTVHRDAVTRRGRLEFNIIDPPSVAAPDRTHTRVFCINRPNVSE